MPRLEPQGPSHLYKTYEIKAPKQTHFRPATCEEVDCKAYTSGWKSTIDTTTELGQKQYYYITKQSGRKFKITRLPQGLVEFEFEAGQTCFGASTHQIRLDRPEIFVVSQGDHRTPRNLKNPRIHQNASDWVEDFAEHQQKLADEIQKGA